MSNVGAFAMPSRIVPSGLHFKIPLGGVDWQAILPPVALEHWPARIDERCKRIGTVGRTLRAYSRTDLILAASLVFPGVQLRA